MHLRLKLQENDIAAMVDQQALNAGWQKYLTQTALRATAVRNIYLFIIVCQKSQWNNHM